MDGIGQLGKEVFARSTFQKKKRMKENWRKKRGLTGKEESTLPRSINGLKGRGKKDKVNKEGKKEKEEMKIWGEKNVDKKLKKEVQRARRGRKN